MADELQTKRIIDLAQKTGPEAGDNLAVDNVTSGTRRITWANLLDNSLSDDTKAAPAGVTGQAIEGAKTTFTDTGDGNIAVNYDEDEPAGTEVPLQSIRFPLLPYKYMVPQITTDLTKSGQAADAKAVGDEIEGVKGDVEEVAKSVFTIKADVDTYIPFFIQNGDSITVKTVSGENFAGSTSIGLYDANKNAVANFNVNATYGAERTLAVTLSADVSYIRLVPNSFEGEQLIILNNNNVAYEAFNEVVETINNTINYSLRGEIDQSENFTNKYYIALNVGVGNQVDITPVSNVQRGYIILPCKKGDSFVLTASGGSAPRAWGFTDESYKLLSVAGSGVSPSELTLIAPSDGYLIVNHSNTAPYSLVATQLIKALSETEIRDIVNSAVANNPIVVDASGNGDYTSFTLACKENYGNNRNIVVKAGTYDIVAEYVAIWGQSAVDSMADADSSVFDGWQYGVKMNGRKFVFEPGSKLVCDWTGHTVDGTHRFSALRVEMDVEIVGLDLDCAATFYAIHDDYGVQTRAYANIYRYCKVIGHDLTNVNCIGGGCKKWSRHIIDNCYFDNNTTGSTAVRYHNTNIADAEPEIYVSDCYFNTFFKASWYGAQTSKMKVYVNNSYAKAIYKDQESGSYTVDNVDLYKWNNTETNPIES